MIEGQPFANQNEAFGGVGFSDIDNSIGTLKLDMWSGTMVLQYGNSGSIASTTASASAFSLLGCEIDYLTN